MCTINPMWLLKRYQACDKERLVQIEFFCEDEMLRYVFQVESLAHSCVVFIFPVFVYIVILYIQLSNLYFCIMSSISAGSSSAMNSVSYKPDHITEKVHVM